MWMDAGVMASEMETAALFVISSIRRCRVGAIMSFRSMEEKVEVAIDALKSLIEKEHLDLSMV